MGTYLGKQPRRSATLAERLAFYSRVDKSGCRVWIGRTDKDGYGKITFKKRYFRANRATWEDANGPIPAGMCVCHTCDVRRCIELTHLFLGSNADNMADRDKKGRSPAGVRHRWTKITEEAARAAKFGTERPQELTRRYGISGQLVWNIRNGLSWKHLRL